MSGYAILARPHGRNITTLLGVSVDDEVMHVSGLFPGTGYIVSLRDGIAEVVHEGGTSFVSVSELLPAAKKPRDNSSWLSALFGATGPGFTITDTPSKLATATPIVDAPAMTPAQLAVLDRRLSPTEQAIVDAYQIAQANALQKREESTPYAAPGTGRLTLLQPAEYVPGQNMRITRQQLFMPPEGKQAADAFATMLIAGIVGGLIGGSLAAWAWPAHRIIGFFLGSTFLGAPVGYGVGMAIAARKMT